MNAKIIGTGSYLPDTVLTNFDLEGIVDTSDEWITTRTGIKERRISSGEPAWQMALKAAQAALENAKVQPGDVDMIVCSTVTPDYFFPSMACILHAKLGCPKAFAFDVNAACSGFVYAMDVARNYIKLGRCKTVLAVSSECLSRVVDYQDRSTCVLFGDGAGAAVLTATEEDAEGIQDMLLISDGNGAEALLCRAVKKDTIFSKIKNFVTLGNKTPDKYTLSMDGQEVFKFAVSTVPRLVRELLERNGLAPNDLDFLIPHQANVRIIQSTVKKLGLDEGKVVLNLDKYGNTSSASVPICFDELNRSGRLQKGNLLALVAFGAGFTAGATLIRW